MQNGLKNGHWSFFYSSSKLNFEGYFKKNLKEGTWTYFDEKGRSISKVLYKNGRLDSFKTYFDKKGRKTAQEYFSGGVNTGLSEYFDEMGTLSARLRGEKGHDILEKYHSNGQIKFRTVDWEGKKNDTTRVYHDNGQIKEVLVFYKNILLAVEPTFDFEGNEIENGAFANGRGKLLRYYDNGIKMSETYYSAGVKNGIAQFYYPSGQLKEAGLFTAGHKSGVWKFYSEEGELLPTEEYRKGMADVEFSEEFTSEGLKIHSTSTVPLFPDGDKGFNRFIKNKIGTTLEAYKGETLWVLIDLDEFGFVNSVDIKADYLNAETKKKVIDAFYEFPRCIPAFDHSLPAASSLSQPYRI